MHLCVNGTEVTLKVLVTEEHKQAHAYSEDGAGAECDKVRCFNLTDLTPLAPEAFWAATPVALGGVGQAGPPIMACGWTTRRHSTAHQPGVFIHHSQLTCWTPVRREDRHVEEQRTILLISGYTLCTGLLLNDYTVDI